MSVHPDGMLFPSKFSLNKVTCAMPLKAISVISIATNSRLFFIFVYLVNVIISKVQIYDFFGLRVYTFRGLGE